MRRGDLSDIFGISRAQASSDLQKFQQLNPGALVYQMSRKRYEGVPDMRCVLHTPRLEDGMAAFLGGAMTGRVELEGASGHVVRVGLPERRGKESVERAMVMAVAGGMKLRVRYWSVNSGKASWRWLMPHAFGHDGYRWHVRAWCCERGAYRDFVLGRVEKSEWPVEREDGETSLEPDWAWHAVTEVRVRANSQLDTTARRAIEMDYGIRKGGVLRLKVREAMKGYLLDHLRIGRDGGDLPRHFEVVDS